MTKYQQFSCVFLLAVLLAASGCSQKFKVTILHMNDSHSHVEELPFTSVIDGKKTKFYAGGFARLSSQIQTIRNNENNVIFLHAGDAVQGTLYFTKFHGEPEFEWLNWMKCDAMVTGNHEFDKGSIILRQFIDRASFPILAGNVDTTADSLLNTKIPPYTILSVDKEQIAVIGMVSTDTPEISNPDDTIIFHDVIESTASIVQMLTAKNIDKIIVLSHIGYDRDIELAQSVSNIDIIVGGHTHSLLGVTDTFIPVVDGEYPTVIEDPSGQPVYIVQAASHAISLGDLDVVFDKHGRITSCHGTPAILLSDKFLQKNDSGQYSVVSAKEKEKIIELINSSPMVEIVPEDPVTAAKLSKFHDGIETLKNQVIANINYDIPHVRVPGYIHPGTGTMMPDGSKIAPLVADALFWKAEQIGLKPDFAIQNAGGVRMDLSGGDVTIGSIYELLPFENTLFILELKGSVINACLESILERVENPDNDGCYPYTSRLRFEIDRDQPEGNRLKNIEIQNSRAEWTALQPDKTYRIATNQYLAGGRDGYRQFKTAYGYRYNTGFIDAELFIEYLKAGKIQ